ncbi:hypothetical protein [Actinomadura flavalba]|uniref:hypothetical protein n=1 Tax=Actinomadura flavalba TaxID=1120938 RepID=UPI00036491C2|nr:hypothetical protein [Actinomadura flavalba]
MGAERDDSSVEAARAQHQAARLRAALRDREKRLEEAERRLVALEASTTYRFGRLVASAARRPGRRGARLPRELYRLWKDRHAPASAPDGNGRTARFDEPERTEDRLLVAGPGPGPIVAGVLSRDTAARLAGHARLVPVYPHDARTVLSHADLDVLLVDARAGDPGGPWAYLGVPGQFDRDRALHELRRAARARGLPVVLWGENPPPSLAALDWDAILTGPEGLADYDPEETRCAPSSTATSI